MQTTFTCSSCGVTLTVESTITSGYGVDNQGNKHCYKCCAWQDAIYMRDNGKITLYLTIERDKGAVKYRVSNWPNSLTINPFKITFGKHNIAGIRTDVWFDAFGFEWHGVSYGKFTQLLHCKQTKQRS